MVASLEGLFVPKISQYTLGAKRRRHIIQTKEEGGKMEHMVVKRRPEWQLAAWRRPPFDVRARGTVT